MVLGPLGPRTLLDTLAGALARRHAANGLRIMSRGYQAAGAFPVDQQRFAALLAVGRTQSDAFREVWPHAEHWKPASVHTAASRMAAKVAPRVDHLMRQADVETGVNIGQLIEDLREIRCAALDRDDLKTALRVVETMIRLHSLVDAQS